MLADFRFILRNVGRGRGGGSDADSGALLWKQTWMENTRHREGPQAQLFIFYVGKLCRHVCA